MSITKTYCIRVNAEPCGKPESYEMPEMAFTSVKVKPEYFFSRFCDTFIELTGETQEEIDGIIAAQNDGGLFENVKGFVKWLPVTYYVTMDSDNMGMEYDARGDAEEDVSQFQQIDIEENRDYMYHIFRTIHADDDGETTCIG